MGPTPKRIALATLSELKAAIASVSAIDGHLMHQLAAEEFHDIHCDLLRVRFRLDQKSATYTFTLSGDRSIQENLEELEEFIRERYSAEPQPPE